ncbi:MAG TPA: ATP-binding protein [Streptosporangiaceae bacterium]|nr:ATP-binding protein [Streptosporangiaceae bacterium]
MATPTLNHVAAHSTEAMCWRRSFPGRAEQAAHVRRFVAFLLADHAKAGDAVQAVAELAANAMQHTRSAAPGGLFVVEVRRCPGHVAVSVTDQGGPNEPRVVEPNLLAGRGRGLHLVAATATRWRWCGDASGRTVTALFA